MRASALVVGPPNGAAEALAELARDLGFAPVAGYEDIGQASRHVDATPLTFFLCAPVADVLSLKPLAESVRFSGDLRLRFLPLIYFSSGLSGPAIRTCIGMGFDDIIALPYAGTDLRERIGRQIGRATYYETSTYFGPDRRNRVGAARSAGSDHGGGDHRRIEIVRSEGGVDVLRDDFQVVL